MGRLARADGSGKPRLGFLGVGWIGRHRLQSVYEADVAEIVAVADQSAECAAAAAEAAGGVPWFSGLDELLALDLDGIVIATPSALHAEQSIAALERGRAVFCQKPLGRNARETAQVVAAAQGNDCLLGVDLSYRHVEGVRRIRELIQGGALGHVFAVNVVFHNAYGPDKPWFYERALSGGGCLVDLGVHLVDLALWALDFPAVADVRGRCFSKGKSLSKLADGVEDYALARIELANGATVDLTCSWHVSAGCEAVIGAQFFGSDGGAELKNVGGSFFDFEAFHYRGTARERLVASPDEWGGRAMLAWVKQLAQQGRRFDPQIERMVEVAAVLDAVYASAAGGADLGGSSELMFSGQRRPLQVD